MCAAKHNKITVRFCYNVHNHIQSEAIPPLSLPPGAMNQSHVKRFRRQALLELQYNVSVLKQC